MITKLEQLNFNLSACLKKIIEENIVLKTNLEEINKIAAKENHEFFFNFHPSKN